MENELPPLKEQAQNLFNDLSGAIANFVKTGKVKSSDALIKSRLNICVTCDRYDAVKRRCTKCGCFTSKKVLLQNVKCPLDKWDKDITTDLTENSDGS